MQPNVLEQRSDEAPVSLSADPRWLLAKRIARSTVLGRSTQLSRLLLYVCRMAISGRASEISEQRVGIDVFRRAPNYDPGVDGIVRSHATRLRQRLEAYFQSEGSDETTILEIPRGGYVPVFVPREPLATDDNAEQMPQATPPAAPTQNIESAPQSNTLQHERSRHSASFLWPLLAGFALALVLVAALIGADVLLLPQHPSAQTGQSQIEQHFWATLFPENGKTFIVPGDSGLVLYETAIRSEITLSDYIAGSYRDLKNMPDVHGGADKQYVNGLSNRRYTSIVDLRLAAQLARLPQWRPERNSIVFARDLTPAEAQNNNLILIGSMQANPWAALIEPEMNFVLVPNGKDGFNFLNRNPHPGELPLYIPSQAQGAQGASTVYGDVVYLPNPSGQGKVLLLSGLWMAGTQAAGNFVLNGPLLSQWLASVARPDGSIPSFELLINATSIQGSATKFSILASRVYGK